MCVMLMRAIRLARSICVGSVHKVERGHAWMQAGMGSWISDEPVVATQERHGPAQHHAIKSMQHAVLPVQATQQSTIKIYWDCAALPGLFTGPHMWVMDHAEPHLVGAGVCSIILVVQAAGNVEEGAAAARHPQVGRASIEDDLCTRSRIHACTFIATRKRKRDGCSLST